jgi:hypothetical protein
VLTLTHSPVFLLQINAYCFHMAPNGDMYYCDWTGSASQIRVIRASGPDEGRIFTVAGDGTSWPSVDGAFANETGLASAFDVWVESNGDVLIAVSGYYARVLRVSASDGRIRALAGNDTGVWTTSYIADGTPALQPVLTGAYSVCTAAPSGTVYFSNYWTVAYIKRGLLYTLGGNDYTTIDGGPVSNSSFLGVYSVRPGVTDWELIVTSNRDATVYRIDLDTQRIYVEAGVRISNPVGRSSNGARATQVNLVSPSDVAQDPISGDVFISDMGGNTIMRIFATNGTTSIVAGNGQRGAVTNVSNADATNVPLRRPYALLCDGHGGLVFSEFENCLIQRVELAVRCSLGLCERKSCEPGSLEYGGDTGATLARSRIGVVIT